MYEKRVNPSPARARAIAAAALIATAFAAAPAVSQENHATWNHHTYIGMNPFSYGGGAGLSGDVLNVPVLVRLDSVNFGSGFAQSSGHGADLRFTKRDDVTRLPHQIERWDSAGRKAEVWVRLDTVHGAAVTAFRMHWGKPGAADSANGSAVFDTANGFLAVYHMNESPEDSARDATGNRFHAAPAGSPGTTAGVIGPARSFDGASQHFEVPGSASGKLNFPLDGFYTLSAWAYLDPSSDVVDRVIAAKHDNQYALKISTDGRWQFFELDDTWTIAGSPYEPGRWTHLTGVMNGRDTYLYVDGTLAESVLDCCGGGGNRDETANFFIGRAGESARRWWWGHVDELRVSGVARSADWARLAYHNQKPNATMMIHADTVPVVSLAGARAYDRRMTGGVRSGPEGVRFRLSGATHARFEVSTLDGRAVWSGTATGRPDAGSEGAAEAVWRAGGAHGAARGLYTVRMTATDAAGKALATKTLRFTVAR